MSTTEYSTPCPGSDEELASRGASVQEGQESSKGQEQYLQGNNTNQLLLEASQW